ncbi:6,7-dimethyl-8-ribityllumazine synthase [Beijerinckia sp. L45]|uniref:6,7-dimethyl-8-ribityllumazine synthase n=1 Tax=Beijerinckia sp. L45 TaxID=1641855 RepID=UPI00131B903A|nr:6,7-dimethyl-8-ribityllumazine synthase [Beijerinckia sp. L45]
MAEPRRSVVTTSNILPAGGGRFLIVEARFYDDIGAMLHAGAMRAFHAANATVETITVPGALEIPIALAMMLDRGGVPYDGIVALGCIIRGETFHFEIVSLESARAVTALAVAHRLCFGNGILTVENEQQAIVRADPEQGDKGGDAARAALALYHIKHAKDQ